MYVSSSTRPSPQNQRPWAPSMDPLLALPPPHWHGRKAPRTERAEARRRHLCHAMLVPGFAVSRFHVLQQHRAIVYLISCSRISSHPRPRFSGAVDGHLSSLTPACSRIDHDLLCTLHHSLHRRAPIPYRRCEPSTGCVNPHEDPEGGFLVALAPACDGPE